MTPIHTHPRARSWRSLTSTAGALILALAALTGCAEGPRGPLVAPSQPLFLADPEPRVLGPLRAVPESDVLIVKKDVPAGTVAVQKSSLDMDSVVRAGTEQRSFEARFTQHQGRRLRVQALGLTERGSFRLRIDYLEDGEISLAGQQRSTKSSPVDGKSYIVEISANGARAFTTEGHTPGSDESSIVLGDAKDLRYLAATGSQVITADLVTRSVRRALVREGMDVGHVKASFKGVREIAGSPCAIFDMGVDASQRKSDEKQSLVVELKLSGEYALRLSDGWDAELFLTGSTQTSGHILKRGYAIPVSSAGFARLHVTATYRQPEQPSPGAVASR